MTALAIPRSLRALLLAACCVFLSDISVYADVRLPKVFGSHMVLQRGRKLPVWGWAGAGENVTVKLTGKELDIKAETTVDGGGRWKLELPVLEAGGPYVMTVLGSSTATFTNVMVGEVWLCSGQSNMEWTVSRSLNPQEEIAAGSHPRIRHIKFPHATSD